MDNSTDRPYVDPAMKPGDQGTEPWTEGEPLETPGPAKASPADEFSPTANAVGLVTHRRTWSRTRPGAERSAAGVDAGICGGPSAHTRPHEESRRDRAADLRGPVKQAMRHREMPTDGEGRGHRCAVPGTAGSAVDLALRRL